MYTKNKIVVAYSGGLDTSVMVKWLSKKYDAEIITYTADFGQKTELLNVKEKALKTGASKAIVEDLKDEFVKDYIFPSLQARTLYEGEYPLATALGRPLIAKRLVEIAIQEGASMIAHGCTGKGNDQVRLEVGIQTLAPDITILAPLREWEFKSREEEIDYAILHNIPISATKDSPYSIDENLWGTAIECGSLEDLSLPIPDDAYQITADIENTPDESLQISIEFEKGIPISLNHIPIDSVELIENLNELGASHGIGRLDLIENRVVGIKSRELYESPAAVILHKAHHELEKLVLDKESFRFKHYVGQQISNLIYDGLWFSPLTSSLFDFITSTQKNMVGQITLKLFKGTVTVVARESEYSLYNENLATYTIQDEFNHEAAKGFIELYGLAQKNISLVQNKKEYV